MSDLSTVTPAPSEKQRTWPLVSMLWRDKLAFVSALVLVVIVLFAIFGPMLLGDLATSQNLRGRNSPPFDLAKGWAFVLGGDSLGRPMLARLIVAARSTMLVAAGAVSAEPSGADALAMGAGYTAFDAPLGSPTELRIDLKGRVAARCDLTTPPSPMDNMAVAQAGEAHSDFAIDCNAPFILRIVSGSGGFANTQASPGIAPLKPYQLSVALGTDEGRQDLGWCQASDLSANAAATGCAYSPGSATGGWSSGEATAIDQTGSLRLRWDDKTTDAPMLGEYRDTIVIELEVRS